MRGAFQYEILVTDLRTGDTVQRLVTAMTLGAHRTRRLWEAARQSAPDIVAGADPALLPFSYVPELDLLLQVFPHDHRLPAWALFNDGPGPDVESALLREFGSGAWRLEAISTDTIRYRPDMRAIVRLEVTAVEAGRGAQVTRTFFAKVYRDVEQAQRSFRAQGELHACAGAHDAGLMIAKPISLDESLNSVVTAALPGVTLERIIRKGIGVDRALASA